jgi:HflK protein
MGFKMVTFLLQIAQETWFIIKEASLFLLFGFVVAGILAVFVPKSILLRFFGTGKIKSVLWASTLGIPLPLCSCGVLPTALGLQRQGATKGATVAFLIATPETGVDSISLSYALMDPLITLFRPLTAMITASAAGIVTNLWGEKKAAAPPTSMQAEQHREDMSLHRDTVPLHTHAHIHTHHAHTPEHEATSRGETAVGQQETVKQIFTYAFRELLDETSYWLVLGIVLSGLVAALLPPSLVERYLSGSVTSMLAMLFIGIPIYTCASSSTPIAAALVLKGLNPGAALVFLLSGPATNLGSLTVLLKFLGYRIVVIYLSAIVVITLLAGYTLNWIYQVWDLDPQVTFGSASAVIPEPVKIMGALVLLALLILSMRRTHVPGEWVWIRDQLAAFTGIPLTVARLKIAASTALAFLYVSSGFFTVQPGEVGIKLRFGRISAAELAPGIHYRFPWPIESHTLIQKEQVRRIEFGFRSATSSERATRALARQRLTVGGPSNPVPQAIQETGFWFQKEKVAEESFLLTGDGNLLDISSTIHYHVKDAVAYAYTLVEPEKLVRSVTLAVLRRIIGTREIDAIYAAARGDVEYQVMQAVQELLDTYQAGIQIVSVRLLYVHSPEEVHEAFRDVASAQEDKIHIMNRAMTFAVEKVNMAQGEAAAMSEDALAFKEEKILQAKGEAMAFRLKVHEYKQEPDLTKFRLHLETIEAVLPSVQKFLRPGATDVKDFDLWLLEPFGTNKNR